MGINFLFKIFAKGIKYKNPVITYNMITGVCKT